MSRLYFSWNALQKISKNSCTPIASGLHGLSDLPYQFIGGRGIRRTFAVIFVRLAYVVENDVPCFVRHMAKEIFFLYLTGFQYFDCPV